MPRKPSNDHPLRNLRQHLGLTQKQFGIEVGAAAITIRSVENGVIPLSIALAGRIAARFHLRVDQLLKGRLVLPDNTPWPGPDPDRIGPAPDPMPFEMIHVQALGLGAWSEVLARCAVRRASGMEAVVFAELLAGIRKLAKDFDLMSEAAEEVRRLRRKWESLEPAPEGFAPESFDPEDFESGALLARYLEADFHDDDGTAADRDGREDA